MVNLHRTRLRAGAVALASALVMSLSGGVASVIPQANALQMDSNLAGSSAAAQRYADRVVALVNDRRRARGLRPVAKATCVEGWATRWSSHLSRTDTFVHSNLGGLLSSCNATYASENIAMIYDGARPADLVRLWMRSPGHRANILSPKARLIGVSVRWDSSQSAWIAVQNFARK